MFFWLLLLSVGTSAWPDPTVSLTALGRRREFGPQQVGGSGEEDEGDLVDNAQEDGQEARQVLQRGDGESLCCLLF